MPMMGAPTRYVPPSAASGYGPGTSYTNTTGGTNAIDALLALIAKEAKPKATPRVDDRPRAKAAPPVTINPTAFKRSAPSIAPGVGYTAKIVKRMTYPGGIPTLEYDPERSDLKTLADIRATSMPASSGFVPDTNPTPTGMAADADARTTPTGKAADALSAPAPNAVQRFYSQFGRQPTTDEMTRIRRDNPNLV